MVSTITMSLQHLLKSNKVLDGLILAFAAILNPIADKRVARIRASLAEAEGAGPSEPRGLTGREENEQKIELPRPDKRILEAKEATGTDVSRTSTLVLTNCEVKHSLRT